MDLFSWILSTLDSAIRYAVPLTLAAMGGLFSERSGIVDIGLEGKMLFAAFVAASVAAWTGSPWLGMGAGIAASVVMALLHGFACISQRGDQIISGLAINFLASGMTITLGHAWFAAGGQTPALGNDARFTGITLPGAETLNNIPLIGPVYKEVISGHNLIVYIAFVAVAVSWWTLYKTRFGLRLRAVGEQPHAVDTAGISVAWQRYRALMITGLLCGIAGTYFSVAQNASFGKEMTAGMGYIALAAVIFGRWRPWQTMGACLLFGFFTALETRMQGITLPGIGVPPTQIFAALPYLLTVVLLAGLVGRSVAPKAIGKSYVKER
ncbi:ABC transporter permease [Gammaproteobacteria bacterium]|nr:ABC transporter permease [Gammaproteobacteria bacterium]